MPFKRAMILDHIIFKYISTTSNSDYDIFIFKLTNASLAANKKEFFALLTLNRYYRNSNLVFSYDLLDLFF